ncbi:hypothetical protein [Microbacterium sp.]|uniref:hypothetical protein n=1 Tax=Microbacterium sp. TaxID=51671 RepID=UPI0037357E09
MNPMALHVPPALRALSIADAPFSGTVRAGDPPTLWTDAAQFGASPAWRAVSAEHLLVALDAARTDEGDCVILPHCISRLDQLIGRGGAADRGAAVTVAVSILRGAAEADALDAPDGQWWVTAEGKPVLALTGCSPWREDAAATLAALDGDDDGGDDGGGVGHDGESWSELIRRAVDVVGDPRRLRREREDLEAAFFASATPGPLDLEATSAQVQPAATGRSREAAIAENRHPGAPLFDLVARFVDEVFAERLRGAAASLSAVRARRPARRERRARPHPRRPRLRRTRPPQRPRAVRSASRADRVISPVSTRRRGRPVAVALVAAALVVTVGALWPAGAEQSTAAGSRGSGNGVVSDTPAETTSAQSTPAESTAPGSTTEGSRSGEPSAQHSSDAQPAERGSSEAPDPEDPLASGRTLVAALAACADDACRAGHWEKPERMQPIAEAGDHPVEIVDEYGGAAALRITSGARTPIVVIVRAKSEWLVREVYDLADPP